MGQVIVRELDDEAIARLKDRARANGRSLESELRMILKREAGLDLLDRTAIAQRARARLAGRTLLDSVSLLREDRDR